MAPAHKHETVMLTVARTLMWERSAMAAVIQSFFDESYGDDNPFPFCMAGYAFTKLRLAKFDREWRAMLAKYHLSAFHMVDCAHGNGEFDKGIRPRSQCDIIARHAISLIQKYASFGVGIIIDPEEFDANWQHKEAISSFYECCIWMCVVAIKKWSDDNLENRRFHYFFEKGYKNEGKAHSALVALFSDPEINLRYRDPTFTMVPKKDSPGAQAADILAWHWYQEAKRRRDKTRPKPRKDFLALTSKPEHVVAEIDLKAWNDEVLVAARARLAAQ